MAKFMNVLLNRFSSIYMNKVDNYGPTYFAHYLRKANAWYGFIVKWYYRYVAYHCIVKPAGVPPESRVLDIGCGVGLLVEQLNRLGYHAAGVDVHAAAITNAVCPQSCLLVGTTAQLEYPDEHFDLIVSREVLEHIPVSEIDCCINEWDRVGKGIMVHIVAVTERGASATNDPTHVNVRAEEWWVRKFEEHGYRVVRKPTRMFFSPFGASGYLMTIKEPLRV